MCSTHVLKETKKNIHTFILYAYVLVSTLIYVSEARVWQKKNACKINSIKMRSVRIMCGVTLRDRVSNNVLKTKESMLKSSKSC